MSEAELNQLERDVEQARVRFTADLARMRSPSIYADFKDEVVAESWEAVVFGARGRSSVIRGMNVWLPMEVAWAVDEGAR